MSALFRRLLQPVERAVAQRFVERFGFDAVPKANKFPHVKRVQRPQAPPINVPRIKKIPQQKFDTGASSVPRIKAPQIIKNQQINCDSWFTVTLKGARWFSKKTLRYSLLLVSMLQNAEKEELGQILYDILPESDESKYWYEIFRKTAHKSCCKKNQPMPLDELKIEKGLQDWTSVSDEERELINGTEGYSNASDEVSPETQITYNMDSSFDTNAIIETGSDMLTYSDDEEDDADKANDSVAHDGYSNASDEVSPETQITYNMDSSFDTNAISETGSDMLTYSDDEEDDADKANDSVAHETPDNVNSVVPSACSLPQEINQDMLSETEEETDTWHCGYLCTLAEYLLQFNPCMHERLLLLSQLFKRLDNMTKHNIAHRNLNINSIFIYGFTDGVPQLVIEDFGRCLVGHEHGLKIPYNNEYIDKGGTSDLMSPEISSTKPGRKSYLDYRKSDLWTAGTLVYQILGADNPFANLNGRHLTSATYEEHDLPPLPDNVPEVVNVLIKAILNRDPNERPTAQLSADVLNAFIKLAGAQQHSIKNVNSNFCNSQ